MKFLVALSCLLAVASAKPTAVVAPVAYSVAAPNSFGYSTYSSHVASPLVHSYSAVAPVAHAYSTVAPVAHAYSAGVPLTHTIAGVSPVAHTYSAVAPLTSVVPVAHSVATVAALEKTQYHAQDNLGQASYGHSEAFQAHNAVQDVAGNKVGSFSYVAPTGEVFSTNYVADALGYRVASNALPVAPAVPAVPVGPAVPADTPEVVAARTAHLHEVEVAKSRSRRQAIFTTPYTHSLGYSAYSALPYHNTVVSHPAVHHAYSSYPYVSIRYA